MSETFSDRFKRLTARIPEAEIAYVMGQTTQAIYRYQSGDASSIKLGPALKLCRHLNISPWELWGEPHPEPPTPQVGDPVPQSTESSIEGLAVAVQQLQDAAHAAKERDMVLQGQLERLEARTMRRPKRAG
jgi:hypothetical protein